ncbi:MAG: undecaprenyl-diphosphatase UppP [Candidatus Paceibacterota bacterium]
MSFTEAIILGIVQGLTEFLPISSSGHLIAARSALGFTVPEAMAFDVLLHLATLAAIVVYFWHDVVGLMKSAVAYAAAQPIEKTQERLLLAIILGTLPAVLVGFLFEDIIEKVFRAPMVVVFALLAGSLLFAVAEVASRYTRTISGNRGFLIGVFQALALIPGMSRSGATIAGGLLLGLSREEAVRFSFLLGLPIIAGAGARALYHASAPADVFTLPALVGSLVAFAVGLMAVHFLVRYLRKNRLTIFIVYRVFIAVVLFVFLL